MFSARNLLCATAFALTTAAASHASAATEVYVQSVSEYAFTKATVTGPGIFKVPDATALNIAYNFGVAPGDPTFTAWGFCIDLFTGVDVPTQYHIGDLTGLFSQPQIDQIYGLAAFGSNLIKTGAPDLAKKLAGVQGAIWRIEYPTFTISGGVLPGSPDAGIQGYIDAYAALAPSLHGNAYVLLSDDGSSQGFVIGVPEPATWAMMIMGFGAVGMVMRSRRRLALAA